MKRLLTWAFTAAILSSGPCLAQQNEILSLTGATGIEELDENEYERLCTLLEHPVAINRASLVHLSSCGLFTRFQAASIEDYRKTHGDILSVTELGLLDGFSPQKAEALKPFISLSPSNTGGEAQHSKNELLTRAAIRSGTPSYLVKYRLSDPRRGILAMTAKNGGIDGWQFRQLAPQSASLCATAFLPGQRGKILIGDFNARFGQGLALWSGFSISGATTAASLVRHPTLLGPSWSASPEGTVRGLGADYSFGRLTISGALLAEGMRTMMEGGKKDIRPATVINLSRIGRSSEMSATLLYGINPKSENISDRAKLSADFRWTPGSVTLFSEFAFDLLNRSPAAVGGALWSPAYGKSFFIAARHYASAFDNRLTGALRAGSKCADEDAITAGIELKHLKISVDLARYPERGSTRTRILAQAPLGIGAFKCTPRMSFRWLDGTLRQEYRLQAGAEGKEFLLNIRADAVRETRLAWHSYIEAGWRPQAEIRKRRLSASIYLKAGIFKADNWADRIYVYERDVPGSFNVPALYGRGYNYSLVGAVAWKRHKFHLRAAMTRYVTGKEPRKEMKLQYSLSL